MDFFCNKWKICFFITSRVKKIHLAIPLFSTLLVAGTIDLVMFFSLLFILCKYFALRFFCFSIMYRFMYGFLTHKVSGWLLATFSINIILNYVVTDRKKPKAKLQLSVSYANFVRSSGANCKPFYLYLFVFFLKYMLCEEFVSTNLKCYKNLYVYRRFVFT